MRLRIFQALLYLAVAALPVRTAAFDQCSADCTHPTKACVCAIDANARAIGVTALGGVERAPVQLRQALEPGDEIASADDDAVVALTCPGGSDMKLQGRFRAVIMPAPPGQDCALSLLAGGVDVLANSPTEVSSGETLMGSKSTQYNMRVGRDDQGTTTECVVFEGNVDVRYRNSKEAVPLATSMKMSLRDGQRAQRSVVSPRDIQMATVVYSRADVARAQALGAAIEDPRSLQRTLQAKYAAVLMKPDDPAPRIELATLQTSARMSRQALYQLNKAESLNPQLTEQRAAIAATKWDVYKQMGREQEAAGEGEKLRRLDPEVYKTKVGRVDSRKLERSEPPAAAQPARGSEPAVSAPAYASRVPAAARTMVISAAAAPSIVRAGEPTTISVKAATREGQAIAGAKVVLSAGGGVFRQVRQTRIEGITDANGVFRTEWLCQPCAAAYGIGVEVTAGGFPTQNLTVDVKTR